MKITLDIARQGDAVRIARILHAESVRLLKDSVKAADPGDMDESFYLADLGSRLSVYRDVFDQFTQDWFKTILKQEREAARVINEGRESHGHACVCSLCMQLGIVCDCCPHTTPEHRLESEGNCIVCMPCVTAADNEPF